MYRLILTILIIQTLTFCWSTPFTDAMQKAVESGKKGKSTETKQLLIDAISKYKQNDSPTILSEAYSSLGLIYISENLTDKALESFEKAVKKNPKNSRAWFRMGLVYISKRSEMDKVEKALRKTIQIDPSFLPAYRLLGDNYRVRQEHEKAITIYRQAIKKKDNSDSIYAGLGESLRCRNQIPEAMVNLEKAIKINPNNAIAHYQLGLCLMRKAKHQEAFNQFDAAMKSNVLIPDAFKVQILTYQGQAVEAMGQDSTAHEYYQKAKKLLEGIPLE